MQSFYSRALEQRRLSVGSVGARVPAKLARRQTGPLPHHPVLGRPGDLVQRREEPVLGRALEVPLLADRAVVLQTGLIH